jgi:hypothetical protein
MTALRGGSASTVRGEGTTPMTATAPTCIALFTGAGSTQTTSTMEGSALSRPQSYSPLLIAGMSMTLMRWMQVRHFGMTLTGSLWTEVGISMGMGNPCGLWVG